MTLTIPPGIDFNDTTSFGFPIGTLLLFWIICLILQNQQQGGSGGGSYTSANTMDVLLRNELGEDVIHFQFSEATMTNGLCVIKYTVKLKKAGSYVVAGGQAESGFFNREYCGTRVIRGDVGDVVSGAVSCPQFYDGIWGIGAFRSASDVPKV